MKCRFGWYINMKMPWYRGVLSQIRILPEMKKYRYSAWWISLYQFHFRPVGCDFGRLLTCAHTALCNHYTDHALNQSFIHSNEYGNPLSELWKSRRRLLMGIWWSGSSLLYLSIVLRLEYTLIQKMCVPYCINYNFTMQILKLVWKFML